jgi:hypothetical protein
MKLRALPALVALFLTPLIPTACADSTAPPPTTMVWSSVQSGTSVTLTSIWGNSASDIFAVGLNTILRYDGTRWNGIYFLGTGTQMLQSVWTSPASDAWIVGYDTSDGSPVVFHPNGSSLENVSTGATHPLTRVWGTSASDVWIAGNNAMVHYNGTTWSTDPSTTFESWQGVWASSPSNAWGVTARGAIIHYDGTSWSGASFGWPTLFGVWGSSAADVWAVGASNTILHYDGSVWTTLLANGPVTNFLGAWGTSPRDVWFVSSTGTNGPGVGMIHHYNGTTLSDALSSTTAGLHGIWGSSATDVWAVGDGGTILHGSPAK